jgi:adenylate cyclase class IV
VVIKQRIRHKFALLTVVATVEDVGFFLDAATTVLYGNEEAFLFLADLRNIIIHLNLNIKIVKN